MLKQLHDAAKRVLDLLHDNGHSLSEEIEAYKELGDAVDKAAVELKRKPKSSPKKSASKPAVKKA